LLELAEDEEEEAREAAALSSGVPSRAETPQAPSRVLPLSSNAGGVGAEENVLQTPAMNPARRRLAALGGKTFEDSPDPKDGTGGAGRGTWWVRRGENLPPPPPLVPDSPSRADEISSLVSSLQSLSIDGTGLRKLSALSKERPVREAEEDEERSEEPPSPSKTNGDGAAVQTTTARFWSQERRFEKVYEGLKAFLLNEGTNEVRFRFHSLPFSLLA
jgi:CLIP-associating protein 1/2